VAAAVAAAAHLVVRDVVEATLLPHLAQRLFTLGRRARGHGTLTGGHGGGGCDVLRCAAMCCAKFKNAKDLRSQR
jgi:hypothetical protein